MNVANWLEEYVKSHGPVAPKTVYEAGAKVGLTRKEIKAARRWQGKYIRTDTRDGETVWSWEP